MATWTSEDGSWKVVKHTHAHGTDTFDIENTKTGFGDSAISYPHIPKVAYNYPELIPQYVKDQIWQMAGHEPDIKEE